MRVFKPIEEIKKSPDQFRRFESAKKADLTPLSISTETKSAIFSGSHGSYETSLETCSCYDYTSRRRPCKHMYRLAMELGIYKEGFVSDSSKIKKQVDRHKTLIAAVQILETEPEFLPIVCEIMYCHNTKHSYICFDTNELSFLFDNNLITVKSDYQKVITSFGQKKTIDALEEKGFAFEEGLKYRKDKYQWCLQNADEVGPIIFENAGIIEPCGLLLDAPRKIYSYLLRRTHHSGVSVDYFTGETTADLLDADKDVIALLIQYDEFFRNEIESSYTEKALDGYSIVLTGTFSSYTRSEMNTFITQNGGKVTSSVSSNTSFLVVGEEPGSKLDKAKALGIPLITENDLIDMVNKKE